MRSCAAALVAVAAAVLLPPPTVHAQKPGKPPCVHGKPPSSLSWVDDAALEQRTMSRLDGPSGGGAAPPRYKLNLDLPPDERWLEIGGLFRSKSYIIHDYLANSLSKMQWALPIIEKVAAALDSYEGFGDYGAEMRGLAKGMNLSLGDVVAGNLVYQLEGLGVNCSNWNNTGPTGQCANSSDGVLYADPENGPGACTSVVAEDASRQIFHGRNLDWNLPAPVRQFVLDIEFQKQGKTQFVGTTLLGYTGLITGLKPGAFTYSNDARCQGGKLLDNIATMLLTGAQTPGQHARRVFEQASSFEQALKLFASGDLVDEGE
jgi:hypothetical protein